MASMQWFSSGFESFQTVSGGNRLLFLSLLRYTSPGIIIAVNRVARSVLFVEFVSSLNGSRGMCPSTFLYGAVFKSLNWNRFLKGMFRSFYLLTCKRIRWRRNLIFKNISVNRAQKKQYIFCCFGLFTLSEKKIEISYLSIPNKLFFQSKQRNFSLINIFTFLRGKVKKIKYK